MLTIASPAQNEAWHCQNYKLVDKFEKRGALEGSNGEPISFPGKKPFLDFGFTKHSLSSRSPPSAF